MTATNAAAILSLVAVWTVGSVLHRVPLPPQVPLVTDNVTACEYSRLMPAHLVGAELRDLQALCHANGVEL